MSPQLLEISIKEIEGIPIILLKGDLTMKCEEILTKTVEVYAPKTQYKIILDFENVTSVNSTGLAILIGIYMILEEEGGGIAIVNAIESFFEIFEIVGLTHYVTFHNTYEEAIKELGLSNN